MVEFDANYKGSPVRSNMNVNFGGEDNVVFTRAKFADINTYEAFFKSLILTAIRANVDSKRRVIN